MGQKKKEKNESTTVAPSQDDNVVIVGKKQWHDYAAVILGRLDRGQVVLKARGLEGVMKTTNACCFVVKHYPEVAATLTLRNGQFEKDGKQIVLPILVGTVWREKKDQ